MIQRIQTLWLFSAIGVLVAMFFLPVATISNATEEYLFNMQGVFAMPDKVLHTNTYSIMGLTAITALIILVTIFLYKKRVAQMRLCVYTAILNLAIMGIEAYYIFYIFKGYDFIINITAFAPVITFILLMMARHGIKKDDKLVKSIDRIR